MQICYHFYQNNDETDPKSLAQRKGEGWNITKLHEQFHVPEDIHHHGNHHNVHTGPQEHNHISIKKAAEHTQLQPCRLDLQTGERIVDRLIIQRAYDRVHETVQKLDKEKKLGINEDSVVPVNPFIRATKGQVIMKQAISNIDGKRQRHPILACIEWTMSRNKTLDKDILSQDYVVSFLIKNFFHKYSQLGVDEESGQQEKTLSLPCFTEYQRNGFVYRCHPLYRGEFAYYDWCLIRWCDGNDMTTGDEKYTSIIGRIHLFVQTPDGSINAVIQSVQERTNEDYGVFGTYWYLEQCGPTNNPEPQFHLVDVDCLEDHVMVIPYDKTGKRYIHIWDLSQWQKCFQTIYVPEE